jgi:hypothetical protein
MSTTHFHSYVDETLALFAQEGPLRIKVDKGCLKQSQDFSCRSPHSSAATQSLLHFWFFSKGFTHEPFNVWHFAAVMWGIL